MSLKQQTIRLLSKSTEDTLKIGGILASQLKPGDVIALMADLGGGKTTLTQGICEGLHVRDYVTSPTFTIIQEYKGDFPVAHFDFYRMHNVDEIEDLGLDMYFNPQTLCIIEWAERGMAVLPDDSIHIHLSLVYDNHVLKEDFRTIEMTAPVSRPIEGMEVWLS